MHFVQYLSAFSVHLSMIQETRGILRSISISTTSEASLSQLLLLLYQNIIIMSTFWHSK